VPETTVLLPIVQLIEVLNLSMGQVTPIPNLPSWVTGVYNWRGEILWIIDLGHLLGLTPWHEQTTYSATYSAVIIRPSNLESPEGQGRTLGLIVAEVQDIEWCNPNDIQSPPATAVTPALVPFLRGYWLKPTGEVLTCLAADAIFAAMPHA
jgi:positive phototaxis protein PixI